MCGCRSCSGRLFHSVGRAWQNSDHRTRHRRSQGVQWVHRHPQGGEKNFRRNLQGKFASAPPAHQVHSRQSKSQLLRHILLDGGDVEVYLVDLDSLLRGRLKGRQLFWGKKLATPMELVAWLATILFAPVTRRSCPWRNRCVINDYWNSERVSWESRTRWPKINGTIFLCTP